MFDSLRGDPPETTPCTMVDDQINPCAGDLRWIEIRQTKALSIPFRQPLLLERYGVKIVTPAKSNMSEEHPRALRKFCRRVRKIVETVGSHLTERFAIAKIRVHDLWHFQHRLIRKVLAHTVMVFMNLRMGRNPLDLDGWVAV